MAHADSPGFPRNLVFGNRTVTLRRLVSADVDGLDALYRSLPRQDRYQRFFVEYAPPRRTVQGYVSRLHQRGFGVVAVTVDGNIAAEAGYALRADGDGEFGITVAPDWRGLGSALLDSVVEQATAAGVPGLQADVLADNRAMLALAAKRGFALISTPDYTLVRIAIGTAIAVPPWPAGTPHPRLLVETTAWRWPAARDAEAAGYSVMSCRGPLSLPGGRCPALRGQRCPLVEEADAIIVALPPGDRSRGALTPIHRFCHLHLPVILQEAEGEGRPPWLPDGVTSLNAGASPAEIVEAVHAAIGAVG
ncbi:MAG: GNAT family N-acetyltransferase [Actinomycetota bacterium]|jgi:GNAT superfamily N-acetyltransferase